MSQPKPIYSYVSAAALALVTVFTFYVFRDFGPQSVIRRFHRDAVRRDINDLNRICTESYDSSDPTKYMVGQVQEAVEANATYEIRDLKRLHHEVLVTVEYRFPNRRPGFINWHVLQSQEDWRVDCRATIMGQ